MQGDIGFPTVGVSHEHNDRDGDPRFNYQKDIQKKWRSGDFSWDSALNTEIQV